MEKQEKKFNKIYIDTLKHSKDIEKWIRSGNRKKGDLRRSFERLQIKVKSLMEIYQSTKSEEEKQKLLELKQHLDVLYALRDKKNEDIQNVPKEEKQYLKTSDGRLINCIEEINYSEIKIKSKEDDLKRRWNKAIENSLQRQEEHRIEKQYLQQFKEKNERKENIIIKKIKSFFNNQKKLKRRAVASFMAGIIVVFGGITVGKSDSVDNTNSTKSYTELNKTNNNFKKSLKVKVNNNEKHENKEKITKKLKTKFENKTKIKSNKKVQVKNEIKQLGIKDKEYTIKSNTIYTEVSDGSGNMGSFSKDSKVKIYSRALVKNNNNGNKQIVAYTKKGQSWEEYAKEHNMKKDDIKKYFKDNNIEEFVSVYNGRTLFGWVSSKQLNSAKDMER